MSHIEKEAKFRVSLEEFDGVRRRLQDWGASLLSPAQREENALFDFPDGRLAAAGCALRLRRYGDQALLTLKGPVQDDPRLKKREEIETSLADAQAMERVLRRLGLCVSFQYAKTREAWRLLWRQEEVLVCLDSTPVGAFVELEGSETAVESLAAQFGWTEFIRQSYVQLYLEGR